MPPIPIYTQSPINAAKAAGVTPKTSGAENAASDQKPSRLTTTTTQEYQGYPPAQPGTTPSLPKPTGTVQNQQYSAVQPTPTRKPGNGEGPPRPHPGAVPVPPGTQSSGPPQPRATDPPQIPEETSASVVEVPPYPPQMFIPAPTAPHSQRGTSRATGPSPVSRGQPNPLVE